jgi:hypothetical protein
LQAFRDSFLWSPCFQVSKIISWILHQPSGSDMFSEWKHKAFKWAHLTLNRIQFNHGFQLGVAQTKWLEGICSKCSGDHGCPCAQWTSC